MALGGVQAGMSPHRHMLSRQVGPWALQTIPHMPQFIGSLVVSRQLPLQQLRPVGQGSPPPQRHMPAEQLSPIAHRRPTSPQFIGSVMRSTQAKTPPLIAQVRPLRHWSVVPHMQVGPAPPPAGIAQAVARIGSQGMLQPPQWANELSMRGSPPAAGSRFTQVVPQQRCDELQVGMHMPGGSPLSTPGPPPSVPMHMPALQVPAHIRPQPPQWRGLAIVFTQALRPISAQHVVAPVQGGEQEPPVPPSPTGREPDVQPETIHIATRRKAPRI
jgi:hypothetical protein